MNTSSNQAHEVKQLLEMLRLCAKQLLLAYDESLQTDLWVAFEKTAEACEILTFGSSSQRPLTLH